MPQLSSTPRPSTLETLEQLYNNVNSTQTTGTPDATGIRSTIRGGHAFPKWAWGKAVSGGSWVYPGEFGWGAINAKAGNLSGNDSIQREFQAFPQIRVSRFSGATDPSGNTGGCGWAKNNLGLKNDKYTGFVPTSG